MISWNIYTYIICIWVSFDIFIMGSITYIMGILLYHATNNTLRPQTWHWTIPGSAGRILEVNGAFCGICTPTEGHVLSAAGWWWLEHDFYFPIYWECNHPNWLSYFSDGFKPSTICRVCHMLNMKIPSIFEQWTSCPEKKLYAEDIDWTCPTNWKPF